MLTITPARNLQGKTDLPPDPDLFLLVTVVALARRQPATIHAAPDLPVLRDWVRCLEEHMTFEWSDDGCTLRPATDDPPLRVALPSADLPWRDYIVFTLLGMGKTVVFPSISPKRCEAWKKLAHRLGGCSLEFSPYGESTCIALSGETAQPRTEMPDESDIPALLGLLLGLGRSGVFTVSNPLVSPLRTIAPVFGFSIEVKSSAPKERDLLARRLQLMQQKNKRATSQGQQFSVAADFTTAVEPVDAPLSVTLPGDALCGILLTEAKCLFPKNSLVIGNMPLESWAAPILPFIRKMGCKVSVQETGRTSFGSVGILHIQSTGLTGRKTECIPASRYAASLPAMAVIAAFARGESVFRELADLRNDEPDGIETIESCIRALGAHHGEMPDGIVLKGGRDFDGFDLERPFAAPCSGAFAIAGLKCTGKTTVNDELLSGRLPGFDALLKSICEPRT